MIIIRNFHLRREQAISSRQDQHRFTSALALTPNPTNAPAEISFQRGQLPMRSALAFAACRTKVFHRRKSAFLILQARFLQFIL